MTLRLLHFSDIHFGGEDKPAIEAAQALAHELAPGLTVVTGDLTLAGRRSEFVAARAWLDRLPQPVVATPGNHDTPYYNLVLRSFWPFRRWRRYIGTDDCVVFETPDISLATINSARGAQLRPNWSHGAVSLVSITEIATRLARAGERLRVFACHHPLVDMDGATVRGGVRNGLAALRVLGDAGVDLVLTGHVHNPFAVPLPYGDGRSYLAGAGTLSRRARGTPASFSVIEATAETLTITVQAWTEDRFEPFGIWTYPRRTTAERGPAEAVAQA